MTRVRIPLIVAFLGTLFLVSMLRSTGGRLSMPLDDSFIYFQYAKQLASGQAWVYQSGDAPTTGATSLAWMFSLALGALLGFDGKAMIVFAMILGGAALAWTVSLAARIETEVSPGGKGVLGVPLASVLVLTSGAFLWGSFSGMEIALFGAGILWCLLECVRAGGAITSRVAVAASVLAILRPEGVLLTFVLVGLLGLGAARRRDFRGFAWLILPVAACFLQSTVNWIATGDTRSTGYLAKSVLAAPHADLLDELRAASLRAMSLLRTLLTGGDDRVDGLGLYAYESEAAPFFVAPGAWLLFLVGVLPRMIDEWRSKAFSGATLAVLWIVVLFAATALLEEPDAHFSRYQTPILPLFLVFVATGVSQLTSSLADRGAWKNLAAAISVWLVGFGFWSVFFFWGAFGDNCRDIDTMQVRFGEYLRDHSPPDAVVAMNDAGALAYFSERKTLDLVGLTSPGFAPLWQQRSGAIYERLESLPAGERPSLFCYFPNWFEFDQIGVARRQGSIRLTRPSIVDAEKVLARADWSLAGRGHVPIGELAGARVIDRVDVADVQSEDEHDFDWSDGVAPASRDTFLRRLPTETGEEIIDAGRTVLREVVFSVARDANRPVLLAARTISGIRQRLMISADDGARRAELYAPGGGRFHDQVVAEIPPGPSPVEIRMSVLDEPAESAPLVLAHLFVVERESP